MFMKLHLVWEKREKASGGGDFTNDEREQLSVCLSLS